MKQINGFENYLASESGEIYSIKSKRLMIGGLNKTGYKNIILRKNNKNNTRFIHRLIAEAFIPNPENKPQVNHKNGIKADNRVINLEWATHSENIRHGFNTGLIKPKRFWFGKFNENHHSSKKILQLDFENNIIKEFPSFR